MSAALMPGLLAALVLLPVPSLADSNDWPCWRGVRHDGHANPNQEIPADITDAKHIRWVTDIPGRGHGSPIVVGERIYLLTADESARTQSVLCLDRATGKPVWDRVIHRGGFPEKINQKATHASSTPACDGKRIYVNFVNGGAMHTTALDLDGNQLWQTKITGYVVHQGFGSSPALYESLVIVSADNKSGGAICGLNRETGKIVWKVNRPKEPNYVSPIIHKLDNRDQLVFSGCNRVAGFDPLTGKQLWEAGGSTTETVTSIVTDGERIFISGGYPKNHVAAVKADGSGEVAWKNITRVYVPSMFVKDGHLYAVMDAGNAVCWDSATGERKWRERLGGTFSASPVLVGDHVHAVNELGDYFVFKADPEEFELLSQGKLGDKAMATPVICGGRVYARVIHSADGPRQEKLYCLGAK